MSQLPIACARLADEMRRLKDRTGLSLAALAARTPFSKSSWARYLNGHALPPWQAVQALCTLTGEPQPPMKALWQLAEEAWSRRGTIAQKATAAPPPSVPVPSPPAPAAAPEVPDSPPEAHPAERRRPVWVVGAAVGALLLLGIGAVRPWSHVGSAATASEPPVGCQGRSCDGGDPTGMDCGVYPGPVSLGDFQTSTGADLEIRYNPRCQAAWMRVRSSSVGDQISISIAGKDTRTARIPDQLAALSYAYSPMVPVTPHGPPLRACLLPPHHGPAQCFSEPQP